MHRRLLLVLLSAFLVLGAACGGGDDGDSDAGGEAEKTEADATEEADSGGGLTITGVDFAFEAPATAPAGETEITFENGGKEPHELILVPLAEDAPELTELIKMPEEKAAEFFAGEPTGSEGPIEPGESKAFTTDLQPGNYGMVCFVESKTEKQPHAFLGMVNQLTVE